MKSNRKFLKKLKTNLKIEMAEDDPEWDERGGELHQEGGP
jgi:hypothetical protein